MKSVLKQESLHHNQLADLVEGAVKIDKIFKVKGTHTVLKHAVRLGIASMETNDSKDHQSP